MPAVIFNLFCLKNNKLLKRIICCYQQASQCKESRSWSIEYVKGEKSITEIITH